MIRFYFNSKDAKEGRIWSIDFGDISTETNYTNVDIYASMTTGFNLSAKDGEPSAWLETMSEGATVEIDEDGGGVLILD